MKATVFTCYMPNIDSEILSLQKDCIKQVLPRGWEFYQVKYSDSHGHALQKCVDGNENPVTVLLDVDCIPLKKDSFRFLFDEKWTCARGALVGCAQRANHINNNKHIYAGPFCMAFLNETYRDLGSPQFTETYRGDVGEELTYRWQENHRSVYLLWPSDVYRPLWNLFDNYVQFGIGTTYEGLFYHHFNIRNPENQALFISKCRSVLGYETMAVGAD